MQRYRVAEVDMGYYMEPDDDGVWVRHSDVVKYIAVLNVPFACNCAEMVENPDLPHWWICPAHGYKRL